MPKNQLLSQPMTSDQRIRATDDEKTISIGELKLFIQQSVNDSINEAMANHCRLAITDEVAEEIPDLLNTIKHIGDGNLAHGAARIQENHRLMSAFRKQKNALATKIANFIIFALMGGLASALWMGIKILIKQE